MQKICSRHRVFTINQLLSMKMPMSLVELISSVQRRRRWTAQQQKAMVEEAEQPGNSISSVARKYEVHPNQLFRWRRLINECSLQASHTEEPLVPLPDVKNLRKQVRGLEHLLYKVH